MRITWLLEATDRLTAEVKLALEDANWLQEQGHHVTVVSRSGPPRWMQLSAEFRTVQDFHSEHLPDADALLATHWTTLPWAACAEPQKGIAVHLCQGYEGDLAENAALRDRIEAAYRLAGVHHVTLSANLTELLRARFELDPHEVIAAIDHRVHVPGPTTPPRKPLRVGLVGPYDIGWKGLATGYAACRLAHAAGQRLLLVRATSSPPVNTELEQPFAIEWHHQLPPAQMGDFYRSLDLLLATSSGPEEGLFLPALEAMACGIPVVMTDVPSARAHRHRAGHSDYALFVPPGDAAAMAEALVVAGSLPTVRDNLRRHGLALAAHYRQDEHCGQLLAVLQQLAGAGRRATNALQLVGSSPATPTRAPTVDWPRSLLAEADRHSATGDVAMAARFCAAAACLAPADAEIVRRAAAAHAAADEPLPTLACCDRLIADGADDAALHLLRGQALLALGRGQEAAAACQRALAAGVRCADTCNRIGVVLYQAGDLNGARRSFERALALEPAHGDANANLSALPAA